MKHISQSTLGALIIGTVVASVLASVGCADGKRHAGSNTGRKMIANTTPLTSATGKPGPNGTVAAPNQPAPALPVNADASEDQKKIDATLADHEEDLKTATPAIAGEYALTLIESYMLSTKGANGFATALTAMDFVSKDVLAQWHSGTFEGSSSTIDLKVAANLTIAADGKFSAKTAESVVRSIADRKETALVVNLTELALAQASADAVSLLDLLNGAVDPAKKISIKKSSPNKGELLVMISEENLSDAQKNSGTNQVRSLYLTFMTAEASKAAADAAAKAGRAN